MQHTYTPQTQPAKLKRKECHKEYIYSSSVSSWSIQAAVGQQWADYLYNIVYTDITHAINILHEFLIIFLYPLRSLIRHPFSLIHLSFRLK